MNNQHPAINDELIRKWLGEHFLKFTSNSTWLAPLAKCTATGEVSDSERYLATQAADWQLEQAAEWLQENIDDYFPYINYYVMEKFFSDFKKAMRPQEDHDDLQS